MELFYSRNIADGRTTLDAEESNHCVKVLRHRCGDPINVVDGCGMLYRCRITDADPKAVAFTIEETVDGYGSHSYHLHMAVAPPKNIDRFEWFAEKSTEIGLDEITPIFGEYSERKVFRAERTERIIVSAAKQSHKGTVPVLHDAVNVKDFILSADGFEGRKLICCCYEAAGRISVREAIAGFTDLMVMIGPEGDFSRAEVALALGHGFVPVSLGESRLRIETAALVAVSAVYLSNI